MNKIKMLAGLLMVFITSSSFAQTTPGPFRVSKIRLGWKGAHFAIEKADGVYANPAKCTSLDGYLSEETAPGNKAYYSAVLAAYLTNREVEVVLDDRACAQGRPSIIGMYLK